MSQRLAMAVITFWSTVIAGTSDHPSTINVHRVLADSALAVVLRKCSMSPNNGASDRELLTGVHDSLWEKKSFGEIVAGDESNDVTASHFHERGKTILEQLRSLDSLQIVTMLQKFLRSSSNDPSNLLTQLYPSALRRQNVIQNYLINHLIALQCAKLSGGQTSERRSSIRSALVFEAMAQRYLIDAFSSGHMMISLTDPFAFLHPVNNIEAHDYYASVGAYVLNSKGEVWRTFGEDLYEWYSTSFYPVHSACLTSLCEVVLVYYASHRAEIPDSLRAWAMSIAEGNSISELVLNWTGIHDGITYYSSLRMPTLLLLPIPVAATWSVRTVVLDTHGIHKRKHYPQLLQPECHDPDLEGVDTKFLYTAKDFPSWMLPGFMGRPQKEITDLIKHDPNLASVRYVQEGFYPPSYFGLLFTAGFSEFVTTGDKAISVGLGYTPKWALLVDIPFIDKVSAEASYLSFLDDNLRRLLSITGGLSIDPHPSRISSSGLFRILESGRIEGGYVWGLRSPFNAKGAQCSLGLESGIIPLGFTYAGITLRLKYQLMCLERTIHGVSFAVIVH